MAGVIKISGAAAIAIHGMWLLAASGGKPVHEKDAAEKLGVSASHLAKVFQWLGKAGLVEAVRGPHGGARLSRPAKDITLLEIVEAVEGPVEKGSCLFKRGNCGLLGCILGPEWARLNGEMYKYLAETTLATLNGNQKEARRGKKKNR